MKISDLIKELKNRLDKHGDVDVLLTSEDIFRDIKSRNIYLGKDHFLLKDHVLLIDADNNFYKDKFAVDPKEGER